MGTPLDDFSIPHSLSGEHEAMSNDTFIHQEHQE